MIKEQTMKLSVKLLILFGRETIIFHLVEKITSEVIVLSPCRILTSSVPNLGILLQHFFLQHP